MVARHFVNFCGVFLADLVSEHDEMRKHAVLLVQKCRQAESVNASLDRECSQIHSSLTSRVSGDCNIP